MGLVTIDKTTFNKSIKQLNSNVEKFKKIIRKINEEFIEKSIQEIINTANNYLINSSDYQGTTDIEKSWITITSVNLDGSVSCRVENDSPFSALVEFGTGLVGGSQPHELAQVTGYHYGNKEWSFVRDLTSNEWVVHTPFTTKDVMENPERFLVIEEFAGYRGKSYLYNALFDYFELNGYIAIYEEICSRYFK